MPRRRSRKLSSLPRRRPRKQRLAHSPIYAGPPLIPTQQLQDAEVAAKAKAAEKQAEIARKRVFQEKSAKATARELWSKKLAREKTLKAISLPKSPNPSPSHVAQGWAEGRKGSGCQGGSGESSTHGSRS